MTVGLNRKAAVEFSFLLAVPTMFAATGLDLVKSSFHFSNGEWGMLAVGFFGAFVTALLTVKYFLRFVEKHTFVPFGIYRIVLAVMFWLLVMR
jgi:undecaprenyl-diphosphatase